MEKTKSNETRVEIKTYSVKEVAVLYGVSSKTLKKWLRPFEKQIGKRIGYFYNPKQVAIIFDSLGVPHLVL